MFDRYMWGRDYWGFSGHFWWWAAPVIVLDTVLRGLALWRSAKKGQNAWFIFLLLINSAGILPAIYLLTNKESKRH